MRNTHQANPDDIDMTSVFGRVRRSLPKLVISSLVVGTLTFVVLSMVAPQFTSQAEIKVTAKKTPSPQSGPNSSGGNNEALSIQIDKQAVNTHVRGMKSRDLVEKIAKKFNLEQNKEFNSALGANDTLGAILRQVGIGGPNPSQSTKDRVQEAFYERLNVYSPRESRAIAVQFSSSDPVLAAEIANAVVNGYRAQLAKQDSTEAKVVKDTLLPQIEKLREEYKQAERAVREARIKTDTTGQGDQQTTAIERQLAELNLELTRARAARNEAEVRAKTARELVRSGSGEANADVLRSPLIQTLSDQRVGLERQKAQLSISLLPAHPNMRRVNAELRGLKRQLNAEIRKVVISLEKEARIAKLKEQSVERDIAAVKVKNVDTTTDRVKLQELEAIARAKKGELDRRFAQYELTVGASSAGETSFESKIVQVARPASVPVFPKKGALTGLVTLATFLLGLAWIVTRALISGARSGASAHAVGANSAGNYNEEREPVLSGAHQHRAATPAGMTDDGPVLSSDVDRAQPAPVPVTDRTTKVGSIAGLMAHLNTVSPGTGGFRTLLAGETNTINAGSEAVDLAMMFSEAGSNTILIDWSADGEGALQKIGLPISPGMTEILSGTANFEDAIKQVPEGSLHVIACGEGLEDPAVALDPDQLNLVLDALDEAYDNIVVVGRYDAARSLFEAIEGRFDAGVTVGEEKGKVAVIQDPPGTFLGFEVADISLVRFERDSSDVKLAQRIHRTTGTASATKSEIRPS
ncbi:MAG: exopolysaccharide transport family protein [Hyphomicrobiaceae bacterium]